MRLTGDDDLHVKVSSDGATWREAASADRSTGKMRFPSGIESLSPQRDLVLLMPAVVKDIWRSDAAAAAATPRVYTLAAVSDTTLTLTTGQAEEIFGASLNGVSMVRVCNVSKAPAQSAWITWQPSETNLTVSDAAHISGWLPGETLRLGARSPTGTNTLQMVAIDISPYMQANYGVVWRQKGLKISNGVQGASGAVGIDYSGNGAGGTAFGSASIDVFTAEQSPVSNSNLLFLRENIFTSGASLAGTRLARLVGLWV